MIQMGKEIAATYMSCTHMKRSQRDTLCSGHDSGTRVQATDKYSNTMHIAHAHKSLTTVQLTYNTLCFFPYEGIVG